MKNLPIEYVFALRACYEADCIHPICQRGKPTDESVWYAGGPSLQLLPLPVPVPKRPWGSKECKNCNGFARGTLCALKTLFKTTDRSDLPAAHTYPPSTVIKKSFEKAQRENRGLDSEEVEGLAK